MSLNCISNVNEILELQDGLITVVSENEEKKITLKAELPVVVCINNYVIKPRLPRINGYIRAQEYTYKSFKNFDLHLQPEDTGVKGSPTYVSKVFKNNEKRNCTLLNYEDENTIKSTVELIEEATK